MPNLKIPTYLTYNRCKLYKICVFICLNCTHNSKATLRNNYAEVCGCTV